MFIKKLSSIALVIIIHFSLLAAQSCIIDKPSIENCHQLHSFEFAPSWNYLTPTFPLAAEPEWVGKIPGPYVAHLEKATLYGTSGVVLVDGKIFQDSLWIWSPLYKAPHDLFPLPHAQPFEGTIATVALEGSSNYYHWMTETLPRIHLLQKSGISFDFLYVSPLRYQFQHETLALMGITHDQIIEGTKNSHLTPKKLVFPSQVARSCVTPQWVIDFLRTTFLKDENYKKPTRKIFISRSRSSIRNIINEDEIFDILKPYGFEKVHLEKLTVAQQARLIHESKVIIGTHGAGMTNIIFAHPKATIIELFQEHLDTTFFELSSTMKLKYYPIKTKTIEHLSQQTIDIRFRNTFIAIDSLQKELIQLVGPLAKSF